MSMINNGTYDHIFAVTGSYNSKKIIARFIVNTANFSLLSVGDTFAELTPLLTNNSNVFAITALTT